MPRNQIEFLLPADIELIHNTSMKLLAEVGVEFPNDEAIAVFKRHGFKADGHRVYFHEEQVLNAVETAPAQFTLRARNPDRNVTVGDGEPVFAPAYGAPFLVDSEVGKRQPTMEDYHNLARLAHALPNQDLSGHLLVEPGDVPAGTAHLRMLHANMVHSDKPFIGSAEGKRGARHTMEMASILFGEEIGERPVTIGLINPLSPLGYNREMLQALMEYARWQQPLVIATLIMAGSTGPITLAGVLVQQNAEILAGIMLTQLISPGTPVVYGSTSTNIDMKTGALAIGSPELALIVVATAQMAHHYGLPSRSGGALTDANSPDAQAGFESMLGLLTAVNSGVDFVLHAAGILSSYLAFSYEKFVLDDEMCGMVRRFRRGIAITSETLAYDVIPKVGPGGNFLMEPHTVKRCRSEFWQPAVCNREGVEAWQEGGRQDAVACARQRWQKLLAEHQDPPMDATIVRQLQTFVAEHSL
ncbi:MAG: trimethylamine methyltransferase family protein [Chloroflexi bacterium]|nr:trimethylamine methyltransferase family protein [Chloroflexota bacterium]